MVSSHCTAMLAPAAALGVAVSLGGAKKQNLRVRKAQTNPGLPAPSKGGPRSPKLRGTTACWTAPPRQIHSTPHQLAHNVGAVSEPFLHLRPLNSPNADLKGRPFEVVAMEATVLKGPSNHDLARSCCLRVELLDALRGRAPDSRRRS